MQQYVQWQSNISSSFELIQSKIFVDAYWHSRKQGFLGHVYRLMTSWAMVVDVYYLEAQKIRPGEDPVEFASRVKEVRTINRFFF